MRRMQCDFGFSAKEHKLAKSWGNPKQPQTEGCFIKWPVIFKSVTVMQAKYKDRRTFSGKETAKFRVHGSEWGFWLSRTLAEQMMFERGLSSGFPNFL